MPSEYQKWIARNEKPDDKPSLTAKEKLINWMNYHKWYLIIGAVMIACAVSFVFSATNSRKNAPDYQIAYIGAKQLPDDTVAALEKAFAEYAEDVTGDGKVKVILNQYRIGNAVENDPMTILKLAADLEAGESRIYLMEDPQNFQDSYGLLAYSSGEYADTADYDEPLWYQWSDCPVLASLDLGTYGLNYNGVDLNGSAQVGSSQELLAHIFIGRRGIDESYEFGKMDNAVWSAITDGVE